MNPDTRIAVHCYAGDAPLVEQLIPAVHARHECPITVLSPEDSPVSFPGVDCRVGGLRQSIGPLAIARQREHMKILLTYSENFFLMHDADSICLSAKLPDYIYDGALWSNLVFNTAEQEAYLSHKVPRLALQPPVFASREAIRKILAVTEEPMTGFIDFWFAQAATRAGIPVKGFQNGVTRPISTWPGDLEFTLVEVRYKGAAFIHGAKSPRFWKPLQRAHQGWLENGPDVTTDTPPALHEFFHCDWSSGDNKMVYQPGIDPTLTLPKEFSP